MDSNHHSWIWNPESCHWTSEIQLAVYLGIEPSSFSVNSGAHTPCVLVHKKLWGGVLVGMAGFEPAQRRSNRFTVCRASPTAPHPHCRDGSISPIIWRRWRGIGLCDRNRTCGLMLPKHALYQLSYTQLSRSGGDRLGFHDV